MDALRGIAARRGLMLRRVGEDGDLLRLLRAVPQPGGQIIEVIADGNRQELMLPLPVPEAVMLPSQSLVVCAVHVQPLAVSTSSVLARIARAASI